LTIYPQDGNGGIESFAGSFVVSALRLSMTPLNMWQQLDSGCLLKTRPEFLAQLVSEYKDHCGSRHQRPNPPASGMLAYLMSCLGMEPNFIGGGRVKQFRTESNPGQLSCGAIQTCLS